MGSGRRPVGRRLTPGLASLLATSAALVPSGCDPTCEGAACASDFSAAFVGVTRAEEALEGEAVSPLDATWRVDGSQALGPEWSVLLDAGRVVVGSPADSSVRALALGDPGTLSADAADVTVASADPDIAFGATVARIGDLDGDGVGELAVGAPQDARSSLFRHDGAVWVVPGASLEGVGTVTADDVALISIVGDDQGGELGRVVQACGDVDADGAADLAIAAPLDSSRDTLAGRVVIVTAAQLGLRDGRTSVSLLPHRYTGVGVGARAGTSIACSSDLDGDGAADIVVGAPFADGDREADGALYVLSGLALPEATTLDVASTLTLRGLGEEHWLGWSVATGDLDGDGLDELVAGAPGAFEGMGVVHVWRGTTIATGATDFPDIRVFGLEAGDGVGRAVHIDDLDGDGFADLLIGAPRRNPSVRDRAAAFDSGALYVFRGAAELSTWRPVMIVEDADAVLEEAQQFLRTGKRITTGDVDGDGRAEIGLVHRFDPG